MGLYLALLAYRMTSQETEELISSLRLPKLLGQTLLDTSNIKGKIRSLESPGLSPSGIYSLLDGYSAAALTANALASDSPEVRENIHLFLNKLRYIKPALTGDDLMRMGIAAGPRIREVLSRLHEARLDGRVSNRQGEVELVEGWLRQHT